MSLEERIDVLDRLGAFLESEQDIVHDICLRAYQQNKWFTVENCQLAISQIRQSFLRKDILTKWVSSYEIKNISPLNRVAVIMAGNIPAVGFHDLLSVFITGNICLYKLSSKDSVIIPFIVKTLNELNPETIKYFEKVEKLSNFDAVIATGSNNTSQYFQQYFSKYPHIIRKNRNSIGVIYKNTTDEEINKLGDDIFTYFGLGCRNISKLLVEEGTDLENIMKIWHERKEIILHSKYMNNYDYNYAVFLLNKDDFLMNGAIILRKDPSIHSRIASVHYEHFNDNNDLLTKIQNHGEDIQAIVSNQPINNVNTIRPGNAQKPCIHDYPDGVDVISFLIQI